MFCIVLKVSSLIKLLCVLICLIVSCDVCFALIWAFKTNKQLTNPDLMCPAAHTSKQACQEKSTNHRLAYMHCFLSSTNHHLAYMHCFLSSTNHRLAYMHCFLSSINHRLAYMHCFLSPFPRSGYPPARDWKFVFDCLVLCFVMGYVLKFGEIALRRVHHYY